jgi:ABC-type polysaccharide transport system permease subunit
MKNTLIFGICLLVLMFSIPMTLGLTVNNTVINMTTAKTVVRITYPCNLLACLEYEQE